MRTDPNVLVAVGCCSAHQIPAFGSDDSCTAPVSFRVRSESFVFYLSLPRPLLALSAEGRAYMRSFEILERRSPVRETPLTKLIA